MKIKAKKILEGYEAIEELTELDEKLKLNDSFLILDTMEIIKPVFDKINKQLSKIEMSFVPKDDKGEMILDEKKSYIPTDPVKRMEDLNELDEKEFDIEVELLNIKKMGIEKLSPKLLKKISFIIKR